jgi:hypothetical protein
MLANISFAISSNSSRDGFSTRTMLTHPPSFDGTDVTKFWSVKQTEIGFDPTTTCSVLQLTQIKLAGSKEELSD